MPEFEPIDIHFPQYGEYSIETLKKDLNLLVEQLNERLMADHDIIQSQAVTIADLQTRLDILES